MLNLLCSGCARVENFMLVFGVLFGFLATFVGLKCFMDKLPADEGRDFAVDGKLSRGKPRGAGIVFIIVFAIGALLFSKIDIESVLYVVFVVAEMITGYLDDASDVSWGRMIKGVLDLVVALGIAITYVVFHGNTMALSLTGKEVEIPFVLLIAIIVGIVFVMINVTNCADGVDGLSGTLTMITLASFVVVNSQRGIAEEYKSMIIIFIAVLLGYLWFNAGPSILLMGDAGSRAMGVFISIIAIKSCCVWLLIPFAILLILDGGLGLLKVSVIKITHKKNFMSKIRTPLHDHVRKNIKVAWANNQVVMRFAIIQIIISIVTVYMFLGC